MTGRTSTYNVETATKICEQIAQGNSLKAICSNPDLPNMSTVFDWLRDNADFAANYAHAREMQADHFADEIPDLAANVDPDSRFSIEKAKLQIDTRKWVASKMKPGKYGDRQHVELSGSLTLTDVLRQAAELRKSRDEPE